MGTKEMWHKLHDGRFFNGAPTKIPGCCLNDWCPFSMLEGDKCTILSKKGDPYKITDIPKCPVALSMGL